jgi:hypothetical protein
MQYPVKVGGGFKQDQEFFISKQYKEYLRGEVPAQTPIYRNQWGDSYFETGVRCILKVK